MTQQSDNDGGWKKKRPQNMETWEPVNDVSLATVSVSFFIYFVVTTN